MDGRRVIISEARLEIRHVGNCRMTFLSTKNLRSIRYYEPYSACCLPNGEIPGISSEIVNTANSISPVELEVLTMRPHNSDLPVRQAGGAS